MNVEIASFFGPTDVELEENTLAPEHAHAFTSGQCHAMALALAELTGWEIGGIGWDSGWYADCPTHVVVRDSNGAMFDVEGYGVEERWSDDWRPIDADWIQTNLVLPEQYLEPNLDAARHFAPLVLERYAQREAVA